MKRALRSRWALLLAVLALILVAGRTAWAGETRTGENIVVPAGTTIEDNLYAAGSTITIDGTIRGNVVAVGREVTINGTVEGNVYVGAQSLVINGKVDDVVAGTQVFQLGTTAAISGSIVYLGYGLESLQGSNVQGDVLFFGSQALLAGSVGKDVEGGMAGFELRGSVGRNVNIGVGSKGAAPGQYMPAPVSISTVNGGVRITEGAQIGGRLDYAAPEQGDIAGGARIAGPVNWQQIEAQSSTNPNWFAPAPFSLLAEVQRFVTLLLIGLLLVWVAPRWMNRMAEPVQTRPLPTLGWGAVTLILVILALILVPLLAVLLAILFGLVTLSGLAWTTVIAGILSEIGIILAFILFVGYIAQAIVGYVIGKWLLARFQPSLAEGRVLPLVVGLLIVVILTAIPIVGGLIGFVIILLGLGALWQWLRSRPKAPVADTTLTPLPAAS